MVIRCERCSTLYELDEALLSPSGSQVQCTKCDHVFTAYPPGRPVDADVAPSPASREPEPPPQAQPRATPPARDLEPSPPAPPAPRDPEPASPPRPAAAPPRAAAPERRVEPPRASWSGSAPVYRPPAPSAPAAAAPGAGRSPLLRRDTVGAFESRLRWSARLRWLVPAVAAVALLAIAGGVWLLLSRRGPPDDANARREAMALAARDDAASLDGAAARLDDALRRAPGSRDAAADRAAVDVLRAALSAEEADALTVRRDALAARQAAAAEPPPVPGEAERAAAELASIEAEARGRAERARTLEARAGEALRGLDRSGRGDRALSRAVALHAALAGDRGAVERAARGAAPGDPWLALAAGWADARQSDPAARERAVTSLGALAEAHPELVRARWLLAATQAALGRRAEALAEVERVLAVNARHEGAQRLRSELARVAEAPPPAAAPATPAAPPATPPASAPAKAPAQPRKRISQPPAGAPAAPTEPATPGEALPDSAAPSPAPPAEAQPPAAPPAPVPTEGGAGDPGAGATPPPRHPRWEQPEPAANGG